MRTPTDQGTAQPKSGESKLPEVAELLLDLGQLLLLTWEAELPQRAEQNDDEWLANIGTMWRAFGLANYGVLAELGAEGIRDKKAWLAKYMDVNAAIHRINAAIQEHSDADAESQAMSQVMLQPLQLAVA